MLCPCYDLLCEAVDEGLDYGLRYAPVRARLTNDTHAFEQTEKQTGGGRGFDAIDQFPLGLCARQCRGQPGFHRLEEAPDTLLYLGVMAGQFHGGRNHQTSALAGNSTGPLDIPGKTGPETREGLFSWIKLGIEARQRLVDITV